MQLTTSTRALSLINDILLFQQQSSLRGEVSETMITLNNENSRVTAEFSVIRDNGREDYIIRDNGDGVYVCDCVEVFCCSYKERTLSSRSHLPYSGTRVTHLLTWLLTFANDNFAESGSDLDDCTCMSVICTEGEAASLPTLLDSSIGIHSPNPVMELT